jgi:hypothetical protein
LFKCKSTAHNSCIIREEQATEKRLAGQSGVETKNHGLHGVLRVAVHDGQAAYRYTE